MYCEDCGETLTEGARFCRACGSPTARDSSLEDSSAQETIQAPHGIQQAGERDWKTVFVDQVYPAFVAAATAVTVGFYWKHYVLAIHASAEVFGGLPVHIESRVQWLHIHVLSFGLAYLFLLAAFLLSVLAHVLGTIPRFRLVEGFSLVAFVLMVVGIVARVIFVKAVFGTDFFASLRSVPLATLNTLVTLVILPLIYLLSRQNPKRRFLLTVCALVAPIVLQTFSIFEAVRLLGPLLPRGGG